MLDRFLRNPMPRRMPAKCTFVLGASALAIVVACSRDQTPTGPDLKGGSGAPLTVQPTMIQFTVPPYTSTTLTVTVQFVGLITAVSSNTACATVSPLSVPASKPPGSAVYVATFTVTPQGVGSCNITVTDKRERRVDVPVEVTQIVLLRETLAAGSDHTCGLTSDGKAYCWGSHVFGQLGNGTPPNATLQTEPKPVAGGQVFATLSAGNRHACGLTPLGQAYCWGDNFHGQLGDGGTTGRFAPTAVNGPLGGPPLTFVSLSVGHSHSCGLISGGSAYCWGSNVFGELGVGTTTDRFTPTAVSGPDGGSALTFTSLTAGNTHTCGVTTSGKAYCWGEGHDGQLGDGSFGSQHHTPTAVLGDLTFASLSAGGFYTCGLTSSGTAYCWGNDFFGQLGNGSLGATAEPDAVTGDLTFASLAAGAFHTCGLTSGGTTYCWGHNLSGQLGGGTATDTDQHTPQPVAGDQVFAILSAGRDGNHTCGLTPVGTAYCWGRNQFGQLGDGTTTNQAAPTPVTGDVTFDLP